MLDLAKSVCLRVALPRYGLDHYRTHFEAIGFEFISEIPNGFIVCKLPSGWWEEPDPPSSWSYRSHRNITDNQGRRRIWYYLGQYWDNDPHDVMRPGKMPGLFVIPRYQYSIDWSKNLGNLSLFADNPARKYIPCWGIVHDSFNRENIHYRTEVLMATGDDGEDNVRKLAEEAKKWLEANFTDWKNPFAYWD